MKPDHSSTPAKPARGFAYPRVKRGVKLARNAKLRRLLARHACEFLAELADAGVLRFTHFDGQDTNGPDLSRVDWCEPPAKPTGGMRAKNFMQILYYLQPLFFGRVVPVKLFQIIDQHSDAAVGKALKLAVEQRIRCLHAYNVKQYPARRKIKEPELRLAVRVHETWARALGLPHRWGKP